MTSLTNDIRAMKTLFVQKFNALGVVESDLKVKKLFRIGLFAWILFNTCLLLPFHRHYWSDLSFVSRREFDRQYWYDWLFNTFSHPDLSRYYLFLPLGLIAASIAGLVGYRTRLMSVLVWFMVVNLGNRAGVILDGGNNLSELLLFYLMFMNTSGREIPAVSSFWRRGLVTASNCALLMAKLQVVLLYLTVGAFKLNGDLWQNGMALYYILQAEHYTHPLLTELVLRYEWIAVFGTYFTVLFQWSFPFLVWSEKTRMPVLFAGVCLHLGIALGMGLLMFGMIMCISYLAFFTEQHADAVLRPLKTVKRFLGYVSGRSTPIVALKGVGS